MRSWALRAVIPTLESQAVTRVVQFSVHVPCVSRGVVVQIRAASRAKRVVRRADCVLPTASSGAVSRELWGADRELGVDSQARDRSIQRVSHITSSAVRFTWNSAARVVEGSAVVCGEHCESQTRISVLSRAARVVVRKSSCVSRRA